MGSYRSAFPLWVVLISFSSMAADNPVLRDKALSILDAHCPDGSTIVRLVMDKMAHIEKDDFTSMITDGTDDRAIVRSLNTVVHEECHTLTYLAPVLLKEKFGRESDEFHRVNYEHLENGRFILVRRTPTFPSREMIPAIPESLRTLRFGYIDTDNEIQTTQNQGVYGLLGEFDAYYQGTRASYDLLSYYQKLGKNADWHDYFQGVNGTLYGCLEFKFFILNYFAFAEQKHPDLYRAFLQNKNLIAAFLELDGLVQQLIDGYTAAKTRVYQQLRGYGWKVQETEGYLSINAGGRTVRHMTFMHIARLLEREMKRPAYQDRMKAFAAMVQGWNPESVYDEVSPLRRSLPFAGRDRAETDPAAGESIPWGKRLASLRGEKAMYTDPTGDAPYPFIDIESGRIFERGDSLFVGIALNRLPAALPINRRPLPDRRLEYEWAVYLDLNNDGTNDYSITLSHFKIGGEEQAAGRIADVDQAAMWKLKDSGGEYADIPVSVKQEGNEIWFCVPRYRSAFAIAEDARFHFETFYDAGGGAATDRLPDK